MAHCCSQCDFTSQFESALVMHHQLHHEDGNAVDFPITSESAPFKQKKSRTMPRVSTPKPNSLTMERNFKMPSRTSSATKLFDKFRSKFCRSKLLVNQREQAEMPALHELSAISEGTSKDLHQNRALTKPGVTMIEGSAETYGCHLCDFDADRITVLDRHLLNDHKVGLENLLKLVMAKTKDSLSDDPIPIFGIRQPYYKPQDEIIEDGEFVIETVTPKIRILKHAATNTDIQLTYTPNMKDNFRMISKELDELINYPMDDYEKDKLSAKMQVLNDCMCKFVDSSYALKKVITKELDSKSTLRGRGGDDPFYNPGLGDRSTPCDWERTHSDRMERSRKKHDGNRNEKTKYSLDSFCFE